ncbi:putative transcription factor interactor and regulator CCHC(Zn) family [Helianthus anomalus]
MKRKFSPRKYFSKEKPKVCPQRKKKRRCWICFKEGHYANECPNRQKFIKK